MDILEFNRRFMLIEEELGLFPDTRVTDPGWASTVTSALLGAFRDNPVTRAELFQLLGPVGVRR